MIKALLVSFIAILLFVFGCNLDSEKNIEVEAQPSSFKEITLIDEILETSEDINSDDHIKVRDYFLHLLEIGSNYDTAELHKILEKRKNFSTIIGCIKIYEASLFYGSEVEIIDIEIVEFPNAYRILLDVKKSCNPILHLGEQNWDLYIAGSPIDVDDEYVLPIAMTPASKREKYPFIAWYDDKYAFYVFTSRVWGYGGEYSSPAEIPKEAQAKYMMVNAPPSEGYVSEALENYIPGMKNHTADKYITEKDMNLWSQKLFGTEFDANPDNFDKMPVYIEQDENGDNLYLIAYGWDPFTWSDHFIKTFEIGDEIHYYYEITNNDYDLTPVPTRVFDFVVKDGIVWSCTDVSEEVGLSIY